MNRHAVGACLLIFACAAPAAAAAASAAGVAKANTATAGQAIEGKVVEAIDAAGYTYLRIDRGSGEVWVAAPATPAKRGDRVAVSDALPMANYHSKTLNRTFDVVYFSGAVVLNGKAPAGPGSTLPAGQSAGAKTAPALDLTNITPVPNGQTVGEVYASKSALAGKKVTVRGRVVKYNARILGKNWLHIRDGSGKDGTNDLTVTSTETAKVGDLVTIRGVLATDRDFGGGYKYPVIVEQAEIIVESR